MVSGAKRASAHWLNWCCAITAKKSHDAVQTAYLVLCKSLAKRIGQRQPHETTTDYFNRAIKQYPQRAGDLTTLKTLYLNTRYGKEAEHSFIQQVKHFHF